VALTPGVGFAAGNVYNVATFASTSFASADFSATGLPAGYAAAFAINGGVLQVTIVATPVITSPTIASGTYGSPFSYTIVAANSPTTFSASGFPAGLTFNTVTGVISGTLGAAGTFPIALGATNIAGTGTATLILTVEKAQAPIAFTGAINSTVRLAYDGSGKTPGMTTVPAGLNVLFTFNGSSTPPTLPGTYAVVATINDPNYQGTANGSLVITITALVRHAPSSGGSIDGSIQVLLPENVSLDGNNFVSGDILVPGTPEVIVTGAALLAGIKDASGAAGPSDHTVTLTGTSLARYVVRRVNAIALPVISAPLAPTGTRSVALHNENQNAGNFATIHDLTIGGSAGEVVVPPGSYGELVANGNGTFVLGEVGATVPSIYEIQQLTLNGDATIKLVGPIVLKLGSNVSLNRDLGTAVHPGWLAIEIATGGLTLQGNAVMYGEVVAPTGNVTIAGGSVLYGHVSSDSLTITGGGLLVEPAP
jgi:hypothetical protein